jgi:hypothetical protein
MQKAVAAAYAPGVAVVPVIGTTSAAGWSATAARLTDPESLVTETVQRPAADDHLHVLRGERQFAAGVVRLAASLGIDVLDDAPSARGATRRGDEPKMPAG